MKKIYRLNVPLSFALAAAISLQAKAHVRLSRLFTSNMVLQQGMKCPVWGWADKGEDVSVELNGKTVKTRAGGDGKWMLKLPSMNYGGPYTLKVKGKNTIELTNIMIGEVWICGGQSNMGLQLQSVKNAAQEIADAKYPDIRLFSVSQTIAQFPKDDLDQGRWVECSPATATKFSGVGYFFGRELYKKLNVPVGLISSNVGGTMIERWGSPENLLNDPDFKAQTEKLRGLDIEGDKAKNKQTIISLNGDFPDKDAGLVDDVAYYAQPGFDTRKWMDLQVPAPWNPLFVGVGWNVRTFTLTADQAQQPIEIHLSRIDDDDITFVNGKQAGTTMNVGDRIYKVPPAFLKEGENTLAVRIINRSGIGGLCGKAEDMFVQTTNGKIGLAGIWKFRLSQIPATGLDMQKNDYPTILYNGMISPLIPYGIKGVIWYQGEGNAGRGEQYKRLFPNLITDWRKHWGQGNFPFIFVSLANYQQKGDINGNSWAFLREAQTTALQVKNTGMAVAVDGTEGDNLHPTDKFPVGYRLMLNALKLAYGRKDVVAASPLCKSIKIDGNQVCITFTEVGGGLNVKDGGEIKGFTIAGDDHVFHLAKARLIDDKTIIVTCDEVTRPVAVRYAWANDPMPLNLYNKENLPVTPFRTDDWKK